MFPMNGSEDKRSPATEESQRLPCPALGLFVHRDKVWTFHWHPQAAQSRPNQAAISFPRQTSLGKGPLVEDTEAEEPSAPSGHLRPPAAPPSPIVCGCYKADHVSTQEVWFGAPWGQEQGFYLLKLQLQILSVLVTHINIVIKKIRGNFST